MATGFEHFGDNGNQRNESSLRRPTDETERFNNPLDDRVIVVKSANHFRAWWTDVASAIIDCDPPGIASNDLFTFNFEKKTKKLYPLDEDAVYVPSGTQAERAEAG